MNPERKIIPEKISVVNIRTLKGQIDGENDIDSAQIHSYLFNNDFAMAMNYAEKIVGIKLTVDIETLDNQNQKLSVRGSYTHEFICLVENLEDFVDEKEDENDNEIDPMMVATLAGISYSTLRGIVFTRTQGTPLNAVILPVVDPKKLIGLEVQEEKK